LISIGILALAMRIYVVTRDSALRSEFPIPELPISLLQDTDTFNQRMKV
jgi:hypothetical protein